MTYTITPLIAEDAICARVRELAASIDRAMAGKPYILLLLLNGALPFAAMLEKHLKSRPAVKAVKISSYAGMRNSGSVAWEGDCGDFQPGVPVLVVDDVLDTGATVTAQDSCDMRDRLLRYFATCCQEKPLSGSLKRGEKNA